MRGLKHYLTIKEILKRRRIFYRCVDWNICKCVFSERGDVSHLLQMRGLKLKLQGCTEKRIWVASFTDAWIETYSSNHLSAFALVASFTDAWIETTFTVIRYALTVCRIFYRCVDWNLSIISRNKVHISRIFYRCVDWNRYFYQWFS